MGGGWWVGVAQHWGTDGLIFRGQGYLLKSHSACLHPASFPGGINLTVPWCRFCAHTAFGADSALCSSKNFCKEPEIDPLMYRDHQAPDAPPPLLSHLFQASYLSNLSSRFVPFFGQLFLATLQSICGLLQTGRQKWAGRSLLSIPSFAVYQLGDLKLTNFSFPD